MAGSSHSFLLVFAGFLVLAQPGAGQLPPMECDMCIMFIGNVIASPDQLETFIQQLVCGPLLGDRAFTLFGQICSNVGGYEVAYLLTVLNDNIPELPRKICTLLKDCPDPATPSPPPPPARFLRGTLQ